MQRIRRAAESLLDCIETLALCVAIGIALALGGAEAAADGAMGDTPQPSTDE